MKKLKKPFYLIFNLDDDSLDMDDIQCMWEALLFKNNIPEPENWKAFIFDVNCAAATDFDIFSNYFDKYFA